MADGDPTKRITKAEALAWLEAHPDSGATQFAEAQRVLLGATEHQAKKLMQRVAQWKSRAAKAEAAGRPSPKHSGAAPRTSSPPHLVSLPPPEPWAIPAAPLPEGMPDPATATPLEVAEWITRQALLAVAEGSAQTPGYAAILKRAQESHVELERARAAAAPPPDENSGSLDAVCARLESEIHDIPERLIEMCAVEWARRKGYRIEGDERGIPRIVRRAG